ncbi:MAG: GNAT family N-acetyltransferase [Myxococcales bacterium]|nr:GNAT family N-acetyltransferase [Myxococcales bacterium]
MSGEYDLDPELARELFLRPRQARVQVPGMVVIDRPDLWQLVTPSFRNGGLNEVAFAQLDEAGADAAIDAAIDEYRRRGIRFRWAVIPGSRPADLADRLAARGLERVDARGMTRPTTPAIAAPPAAAGIEVTLAQDLAGIDRFTEVMSAGWSVDPGPFGDYHRRAIADSPRYRFWVAALEGRPVGAGAAIHFERSSFLIGAVVLPEARGRGVYRALIAARLADAAACGIGLATVHALARSSAPILEGLGFEAVADFPIFHG